jgi:hypothetical protein
LDKLFSHPQLQQRARARERGTSCNEFPTPAAWFASANFEKLSVELDDVAGLLKT